MTEYTIPHARFLPRIWGFTRKVPMGRHVKRAGRQKIAWFRKKLGPPIEERMRAGYTACVQDEAICVANARLRKGIYTPKEVRGVYTYTGSHSKTALVDFSDQITKIYHQGASMAQSTFEQSCGGHNTFEHCDEMRLDRIRGRSQSTLLNSERQRSPKSTRPSSLSQVTYSGDHKFVQNNAAFLLANLSMSKVNLAVL